MNQDSPERKLTSALAARYGQLPYPKLTHEFTHPARLAAVAQLFGARPTDPSESQVLELACGSGANIDWIARTLPSAGCLGVDLVEDSLIPVRQAAERDGVGNLRFETGNLLDQDFGMMKFDYIIAHGFLSWTTDTVQDRIFKICRDHLAENGIAMISYNAMPGSSVSDSLQKLFQLECSSRNESLRFDRTAELDSVDRVLQFFETSMPASDALPHGLALKENINRLKSKDSNVLLNDELSLVNEPFYLLQFSQWAAEHDLAYVSDVDLRLDWMDLYPKSLRRAVVEAQMPRLKALQYADYVFNTGFRRSIVCRHADSETLCPMPQLDAIDDLRVTSSMVAIDTPNFQSGIPVRYRLRDANEDQSALELTDPLCKAMLQVLTSGQGIRFRALIDRITQSSVLSFTDADLQEAKRFILHSASVGRMSLSLGEYRTSLPGPD